MQRTVRESKEEMARLRHTIHEGSERSVEHWRELSKQDELIQAAGEGRYEQSQKDAAEAGMENEKRFRAIGNAVGAFADILHVSNPLVAY